VAYFAAVALGEHLPCHVGQARSLRRHLRPPRFQASSAPGIIHQKLYRSASMACELRRYGPRKSDSSPRIRVKAAVAASAPRTPASIRAWPTHPSRTGEPSSPAPRCGWCRSCILRAPETRGRGGTPFLHVLPHISSDGHHRVPGENGGTI
jgi:hypothetical protein